MEKLKNLTAKRKIILKKLFDMQQALLTIDVQQELINGNQNQPGEVLKKQLIENVNTRIDKAVTLVISIIFIHNLDITNEEESGSQIHSAIRVFDNATILDKKATNASYQTPLLAFCNIKILDILSSRDVKSNIA